MNDMIRDVSRYKQLTLADQQYLQIMIGQAEKVTQSEIVLAVSAQSGHYPVISLIISIITVFCGMGLIQAEGWWPLSFMALQITQAILILSLQFILMRSGLVTYFVPRSYQQRRVNRYARTMFLDDDLYRTQNRNALLVYLSLKERIISFIPDKRLHQIVPHDDWVRLIEESLKNRNRYNLTMWLTDVIQLAARTLQHYDPATSDNPNELSNRVRFV